MSLKPVLHPLVLINAADHLTRETCNQTSSSSRREPVFVAGSLLGSLEGGCISISNSFEIPVKRNVDYIRAIHMSAAEGTGPINLAAAVSSPVTDRKAGLARTVKQARSSRSATASCVNGRNAYAAAAAATATAHRHSTAEPPDEDRLLLLSSPDKLLLSQPLPLNVHWEFFQTRLDQYSQVFPSLSAVGWYIACSVDSSMDPDSFVDPDGASVPAKTGYPDGASSSSAAAATKSSVSPQVEEFLSCLAASESAVSFCESPYILVIIKKNRSPQQQKQQEKENLKKKQNAPKERQEQKHRKLSLSSTEAMTVDRSTSDSDLFVYLFNKVSFGTKLDQSGFAPVRTALSGMTSIEFKLDGTEGETVALFHVRSYAVAASAAAGSTGLSTGTQSSSTGTAKLPIETRKGKAETETRKGKPETETGTFLDSSPSVDAVSAADSAAADSTSAFGANKALLSFKSHLNDWNSSMNELKNKIDFSIEFLLSKHPNKDEASKLVKKANKAAALLVGREPWLAGAGADARAQERCKGNRHSQERCKENRHRELLASKLSESNTAESNGDNHQAESSSPIVVTASCSREESKSSSLINDVNEANNNNNQNSSIDDPRHDDNHNSSIDDYTDEHDDHHYHHHHSHTIDTRDNNANNNNDNDEDSEIKVTSCKDLLDSVDDHQFVVGDNNDSQAHQYNPSSATEEVEEEEEEDTVMLPCVVTMTDSEILKNISGVEELKMINQLHAICKAVQREQDEAASAAAAAAARDQKQWVHQPHSRSQMEANPKKAVAATAAAGAAVQQGIPIIDTRATAAGGRPGKITEQVEETTVREITGEPGEITGEPGEITGEPGALLYRQSCSTDDYENVENMSYFDLHSLIVQCNLAVAEGLKSTCRLLKLKLDTLAAAAVTLGRNAATPHDDNRNRIRRKTPGTDPEDEDLIMEDVDDNRTMME